jgi:hypothetical protein
VLKLWLHACSNDAGTRARLLLLLLLQLLLQLLLLLILRYSAWLS